MTEKLNHTSLISASEQRRSMGRHQLDLSLRHKGYRALGYFVIALWVIHAAQALFHYHLNWLGVYPQTFSGLFGIVTSPLIHGDWGHLGNNTVSLIVLGALIIYGFSRALWPSVFVIWIVSGAGVWLFGRESYHIGASGLTHGLFYFLFAAAIIRRDKTSIAIMLVAVLMYGSMVLGVLPWDPKISFEGHLFGAIGGGLSAFLFQQRQPKPYVKQYDWEVEDDLDDEEPYWIPPHQNQAPASEIQSGSTKE